MWYAMAMCVQLVRTRTPSGAMIVGLPDAGGAFRGGSSGKLGARAPAPPAADAPLPQEAVDWRCRGGWRWLGIRRWLACGGAA